MKTQEELLKLAQEVIEDAIQIGWEESLYLSMQELNSDEKCILTNYSLAVRKLVGDIFVGKMRVQGPQKSEIQPIEVELFEPPVSH